MMGGTIAWQSGDRSVIPLVRAFIRFTPGASQRRRLRLISYSRLGLRGEVIWSRNCRFISVEPVSLGL